MTNNSNLARDRATEAELLRLLFPDGVGNMSVEAFRSYLQEFLVFYKAILSESGDVDYRECTTDVVSVDAVIRQCVQNALNRRG